MLGEMNRTKNSIGRPLTAIMLAGRMRPSALREALDVHVLSLPVGWSGSLLDNWMNVLGAIKALDEVRVVVNTRAEVEALTAVAAEHLRPRAKPRLRITAEPAPWRGPAGVLRDVTLDLSDETLLMVCEAARLPPPSLEPLLQPFRASDAQVQLCGVVGVVGEHEPAGAYAFHVEALSVAPRVGYFDLKEQFLPNLARHGRPILTARLADVPWRFSSLEDYLLAVQHSLNGSAQPHSMMRVSESASVAESVVLDGFCIVEPGATIEAGAVIHESVVLAGATVGRNAIVSRSVVGPLGSVAAGAKLVRACAAAPSSAHTTTPARLRRRAVGEVPS